MEVLRIATAGSVDDGKSTLIGRLLFETNSISVDRLEAIEQASKRKGLGFVDLSLLTDGLISEREQGITIDVAHIYFNTPRRKFIIADSPGHLEYTRNMITGASKADAFIILVDARHGVVDQTHRHLFISNLLRIPFVIVCINKMDLADYSKNTFEAIRQSFLDRSRDLPNQQQEILFLPISALKGENLTKQTDAMRWYVGKPLLDILETLPVKRSLKEKPLRLPIQYVISSNDEGRRAFKGYAGRLLTGVLSTGDQVVALPSGRNSRVSGIFQHTQALVQAVARQSVTVTLEDDIDIRRGDMLVKLDHQPLLLTEFGATLCWLSNLHLTPGKTYLLLRGTQLLKAKIMTIDELAQDSASMRRTASVSLLRMNEIGWVQIRAEEPAVADRYEDNMANGSFILIDEYNNDTVGVGFIA